MARGSKLRRRQTDELVHSSGIGLRHLAAVRCDAVIAPPLVIQMRVGAVLGFFDETLFEHLVDRSIEHAGAKLQLSARAQRNLALQCVAVAFPFGERQKDVENGGREGYTVFVGHTSTRSDIILPSRYTCQEPQTRGLRNFMKEGGACFSLPAGRRPAVRCPSPGAGNACYGNSEPLCWRAYVH